MTPGNNPWRSGDTVPTPSSINISPPLEDPNHVHERSDDNIAINIEPPVSLSILSQS
jgi:hypothetical protein